ncbi:thiol-disulfide oxidoreductase [Pseudalgibacter alginicilyticus]|uniref:Thiol-disulfide oxidoreductase n=1 Tax=Pseudalgibacter alginicilyticus TaxID=1736674 RepID=A0A0P0D921_9FLAO|nr:TlpA disulfide reductase family protein [Pseudalgibacter alginicilyticus]ALJ04380.1 thiol-disulfide oxidoreductase [Pseudalgibacter alginicilyticus]
MKISKPKTSNILFFAILLLLIIPQTRQPIQVFIHKGLALFSPSVINDEKQKVLRDYDWKLVDANGNLFNFEDAKGKVILVNFWATWCPPCIAEMPSLQELYEDYQDKILFLLVSNESSETINKFIEGKGYSFGVYGSLSNVPKDLATSSIPRTFLIDQSGAIVIDKTGAANWNSYSVRNTIDNLLK